jgi:hypothetical protein
MNESDHIRKISLVIAHEQHISERQVLDMFRAADPEFIYKGNARV